MDQKYWPDLLILSYAAFFYTSSSPSVIGCRLVFGPVSYADNDFHWFYSGDPAWNSYYQGIVNLIRLAN